MSSCQQIAFSHQTPQSSFPHLYGPPRRRANEANEEGVWQAGEKAGRLQRPEAFFPSCHQQRRRSRALHQGPEHALNPERD